MVIPVPNKYNIIPSKYKLSSFKCNLINAPKTAYPKSPVNN